MKLLTLLAPHCERSLVYHQSIHRRPKTISSTHGRRCARNPPKSRCSLRQIATTPSVGAFLLLVSAPEFEALDV